MTEVIRFKIDREKVKLSWEEYEVVQLAQEGELEMRPLRKLVARFMVDEQGQPLPRPMAMKILAGLDMEEVPDVFIKFTAAMKEAAVPPTNGGSLRQPLEAGPVSESPTG